VRNGGEGKNNDFPIAI